TLDGVARTLDAETVLVCDANGPTAIAGIMGGQVSEVSEATTSVLLEVANWNGTNILRTSRQLGLRSEASSRFEKQLHPELAMRGQRIASRLMVELCDATLVPGTIDVSAGEPDPTRLTLRSSRVSGLLGMEIGLEDQAAYLERLGFGVELGDGALDVTVPPDRHYDVTREVDLVEEVGRIHGLDGNLPSTLPSTSGQVGGLSREQRLRRRAEDTMRDLGFDEVVGWSFTDPGEPARLRIPPDDGRGQGVVLANPLSEEQSVMRTTLLGSLLDAARGNLARDIDHVALFESGRVYLNQPPTGRNVQPEPTIRPIDPLAGQFVGERGAAFAEPHRVGALEVGASVPASWRGTAIDSDFFTLKGVLEGLAGQLGTAVALEASPEPFLHPGRAARIGIDGSPGGWIGEIHPLVCRAWDIESAVGFEVDLAALVAAAGAGEEVFADVSPFPSVRQDLAVVVPDEVTAARVAAAVEAAAGDLLASIDVFDLYTGEQVGEGSKSLALRLELAAFDRTLAEDEVATLRAAIEAGLGEIGGSIRG
ncbi:MAG TPA: phenylalanine--tRNA ligase subunit beta, partial [Solirubrobacterales bacterium]